MALLRSLERLNGGCVDLAREESDRRPDDIAISAFSAFCDWAHDRLVALGNHEKNAVVLETYAFVMESRRQNSLAFVHAWTADAYADAADKALSDEADDDGERHINRTKLPTWRRWGDCLGRAVTLPGVAQPHPAADTRLFRELARGGLEQGLDGEELLADDFLRQFAERLGYKRSADTGGSCS